MIGRLAIDSGTGWRTINLQAYLDPDAAERAEIDSGRWIKALRTLAVDGQTFRGRFTIRGDSLWWFAELYLHKERRIEAIHRAAAAFDAMIERERPLHIRWLTGDPEAAFVAARCAATRRIPFSQPPFTRAALTVRRARLRIRAALLHARAIRRRRAPGHTTQAPIVAFVHRAFVDTPHEIPAGERYIGHILRRITTRAPRSLLCVTVGPRRNFRARRWWDPLVGGEDITAPAIEQFYPSDGLRGGRLAWRQRRRWLHLMERSDDVRRHAVIAGIDCWPLVHEQLTGIAWLQWPWSASAMDHAAAAIDVLRPAECITYAEAGGWGRALALECRRRGVPLVGLQHGFIYRHWLNYLHEPDEMLPAADNPADAGFPRPALTLVFDEYAERHLVQQGRFPPSSIRVTGSATRDELVAAASRLSAADRTAAKHAAGAREDQRLIVVATKFTQARSMLPQLVEAVRAMPDMHVAIKTHPAETTASYASIAAAPNVRVLPASEPLAPLLAASSAIVTVNSTVAIDAAWIGVPALVLGLPNNLSPFVQAGAMLGATDAAGIAAALGRLVADDAVRTRLLETVRSMTRAPEGNAAERGADAVLQLLGTRDAPEEDGC